MLDLLRTRRWLGFTAVVLFAIVAFGLLSAWQWARAETKRAERQLVEHALADAPSDAATLAQHPLAAGEWRSVTAHGTYDDQLTVLVRRRPLDATNGMWVMTPLRTDSGLVAWVNRGWVKAAATAEGTPDVPPAPAGEVEVDGVAREFEVSSAATNEGLPRQQVAAAALANLPPAGAAEGFYIQAQSSMPDEPDLVAVPLPEVDETRNISYAVQWILFAVVAIGGWFYFLSREARDSQRERALDTTGGS